MACRKRLEMGSIGGSGLGGRCLYDNGRYIKYRAEHCDGDTTYSTADSIGYLKYFELASKRAYMSEQNPEREPLDDDFYSIMQEFSESYTEEVKSKFKRLDKIIGSAHWGAVGAYKEQVVKEQIVQFVPKQFTVGTGFVLSNDDGQKILSKQIDLLIWDSTYHVPYFQAGDFVIVSPAACKAVVEVKGRLDSTQLYKGLETLESVSRFAPELSQGAHNTIHTYLIGLDTSDDFCFPNTVWNQLYKMYSYGAEKSADEPRGGISIAKRRQLSSNSHETWPLRWITAISVLGHGLMRLEHMEINDGDQRHHFASYPVQISVSNESDNSISILRELILAGLRGERRVERFYWHLFDKPADTAEEKEVLFLPSSEGDIGLIEKYVGVKAFRPKGA